VTNGILDCIAGRSSVQHIDDLFRDISGRGNLRFGGGGSQVGSDDDVIQLEEGAFRNRFFSEDTMAAPAIFFSVMALAKQFFIDPNRRGRS